MFCPGFLCLEVEFWTIQKSWNLPVWRGKCSMKVRRGELHQEYSFSWSQGIIPIENYSVFLTFYFEFLPDGIIQVPRFSGQTRSLFANKFPLWQGDRWTLWSQKKAAEFLDQPFCPRCLPLVFLPYLSTVFSFKWLLGGRCVDVAETSCPIQWSSSLEVVLYFILCAWP